MEKWARLKNSNFQSVNSTLELQSSSPWVILDNCNVSVKTKLSRRNITKNNWCNWADHCSAKTQISKKHFKGISQHHNNRPHCKIVKEVVERFTRMPYHHIHQTLLLLPFVLVVDDSWPLLALLRSLRKHKIGSILGCLMPKRWGKIEANVGQYFQ